MDKCMNDNKILEVCGDLAGTKYYGYYSTIFMSQGKYWHHDGNFFIFDPGGDTNNIYIYITFLPSLSLNKKHQNIKLINSKILTALLSTKKKCVLKGKPG